MSVPVQLVGRHARDCPERYWTFSGGWETRDEHGRAVRDKGHSLREMAQMPRWFVVKCRGCGREGLARAAGLAVLLNQSLAHRGETKS